MIIFHSKRAATTIEASSSAGPITRSKSRSSGDSDENRGHSQSTASTSLRTLRTLHSSSENSSGDNVDELLAEAIR